MKSKYKYKNKINDDRIELVRKSNGISIVNSFPARCDYKSKKNWEALHRDIAKLLLEDTQDEQ